MKSPAKWVPPFDIFYLQSDGQLIWQCTAATLEIAKLRIKALKAMEYGDYVISGRPTGHKMLIKSDGSSASFNQSTTG